VALAMAHCRRGPVTLVEAGDEIAPHLSPRARDVLLKAMARHDVRTVLGQRVARVTADHVLLQDGSRIPSAFTLGAAGARPYAWLAQDLPVNAAGFIEVGPTLQLRGELGGNVFATGDCAAMTHAPRPKAGVFAVRQGPILAANLAAMLHGRALTEYHPQDDYLKLISLGGKRALCDWRGVTLHGAALWRLKDWIDRGFMAKVSR
jgi:selenide,water dikinase